MVESEIGQRRNEKTLYQVYPTTLHPELYVLGPFLSSNFFPQIFLFFCQEKQEKQEAFPMFGNVTEGKIFGRLRIPMFGKKKGKYGNTKNCAKKKLGS